jgi:hemolysin III
MSVEEGVRPRLRGVLHLLATPVFLAVFVVLATRAPRAGPRAAVAIYGLCVTLMLGVSALYHSGRLSPSGTRRLKRVDHSTILLAIAGTYTAVTGLALHGTTRVVLLAAIWGAASLGIGLRMAWLEAPYPVVAATYLVVGWLALVDVPAYVRGLSSRQLSLVVAGGVLYTAGGVVYALHRPNPWPRTFGYHEVFHALVIGGAAAHCLAVAGLVRAM